MVEVFVHVPLCNPQWRPQCCDRPTLSRDFSIILNFMTRTAPLLMGHYILWV